jgi:predicted nuclease with TOPRIM domain
MYLSLCGVVVIFFKKNKIKGSLKKAFSNIKEEFNQHLDSINQNTDEINANYDYIMELEAKMEKLEEKTNDLQMEVSHLKGEDKKIEKVYPKIYLTNREKEIFKLLYSNEELTFIQISRKLSLTKQLVERYISNLVVKGVPILKSKRENEVYLSLEPHFKAQQAKENLVGLDSNVLKGFID